MFGKKLIASFAAAAALGAALVTGTPARAQEAQDLPEKQITIISDRPAAVTEKFDPLIHACTADHFNVGAQAIIAIKTSDLDAAGKSMLMTVDENGNKTYTPNFTPAEREALMKDLNELWRAAAEHLNAAEDMPMPAPPGFGYEHLRQALNDNMVNFQIQAAHDVGVPIHIIGFNHKIPQPGCPAPKAK